MENLLGIKAMIDPVLTANHLRLYEISWRKEGKTAILQVAIMREDGTMDIDTCAMISEQISDVLDKEDAIAHEYFLEVCSPGAERELRGESDILHAVGEYVYIKYLNPKAGRDEIYGTLMEVSDDVLHIAYMDKAVKRQLDVEKDNIAMIRLAVKI